MEEVKKKRVRKDNGTRITVRLTPHETQTLLRLRTEGLTEGETPRTATEILTRVLREADRKQILNTDEENRVKLVGEK
jgi:hypothetical protein